MNAGKSVLGVLGMCWVCLANPTQLKAARAVALRGAVLGVLGFRARARACAKNMDGLLGCADAEKMPRETLKTRQTQHTQHRQAQCSVFKGFFVCWVCVGLADSVLGCGWGAWA